VIKETILLVEDEIIVAKNIQNILINQGYDVPFICDNGEDAIIKARETNPSLVLMDIMLKGKIDGIDTAEYIRFRLNIPVVFLTAYEDELTLNRASLTEPYGYLLKPVSERELHAAIQMAIQTHRFAKKLKEREEWLSILIKSIGDGIASTNSDLIINFVNPAAEKLLKLKATEVVGKKFTEILKIKEDNIYININQLIQEIISNGKSFHFYYNHYLQVDEEITFPVDGKLTPLWNEKGDFNGLLFIFRDITHLKRIEEESFQRSKMESLNLLAGGIAHDFNNMLTILLNNINFIQQSDPSKTDISPYLADMMKACNLSRELTSKLISLSKENTLHMQVCDIHKIIKENVSLIIKDCNIEVQYNFISPESKIEIDPLQISQVIQNIVINAKEAMASGGSLYISTEYVNISEIFPEKMAENSSNNTYIKISFTDTGKGIEQYNLKKIFDPYFTTKTKGNGLGLTFSQSIIKSHGGYLIVESELGKGSTFTILLPASDNNP